MAHQTVKKSYANLVDRLNRFPQGVVPSGLLDKILGILFSEKEAALVSLLPIKPFRVQKAAHIWKMDLLSARKVLDELCSRALLVDIEQKGQTLYVLPPPMAGFFEFSLMRIRNDINQKALAELFFQYLNVEEDFIKELFTQGETQLGRVFVHEPVLSEENALHVLDFERASHVVETASHMAIGICYCRHKMQHIGNDCSNPKEICMTFNTTAASLIKHGYARKVDKVEGIEYLYKAYEYNLVQFGENVRQDVNFICNCCACCCEAMIAARRFALLHPIHTTPFLPKIDYNTCDRCGKCVNVCPVEAMAQVSANDPRHPKQKMPKLNKEICLGCGICARVCPTDSILLNHRLKRVITPLNGAHKAVVMAIERGRLQDLIFDNRVLFSHRALAAVFGVILKLSPVKKVLASKQVRSRYLDKLIHSLSDN
ncbi:MAG: 4Fe-4S dicluster domain-containing protein [Desulfobacteraceae bacterium]|nr:4Fe-4S dicluster domain-containing protein [Desulfobacteraceae bacterium]